jgi:hypothetical protein
MEFNSSGIQFSIETDQLSNLTELLIDSAVQVSVFKCKLSKCSESTFEMIRFFKEVIFLCGEIEAPIDFLIASF